MSNIEFTLTSAIEKCFCDTPISAIPAQASGSALLGERYSFQLAWRAAIPTLDSKLVAFLRVDSPLKDYITAQSVESVPVRFPAYKTRVDDGYLRTEPGLYPDLLVPCTDKSQLYIVTNDTRSLWIDVTLPTEGLAGGDYPITLSLVNGKEEPLFSATFTLKVIPAVLPAQKLQHTNWFHADCLADYYRVPVWSEEHWRIVENFIATAVKNGINMILTPVFTPPLDTAVGGERTTVQLVKVFRRNGEWSFDFELLDRWIDVCERCGVGYYEISHLFTQWGAEHAPKIMVDDEGDYRRVFGWDTDSLSDEYKGFLNAFLPALTARLNARGITKDRVAFHVSDEPHIDHLERYRADRAIIAPYLEGYRIMDALSNYEFYKTGALDHPVPASNHIAPFLENNVPDLWTYYCCSQSVGVSNRFLSMPGGRTRVLGLQLYKFNIKGFLQWGYNFYNTQYSIEHIDPYLCSDGGYFVPSGDAFTVYPAEDGTALETMHLRQFALGLIDQRACALAESLVGRDKVVAAIEEGLDKPLAFDYCPKGDYSLLARERVNALIADALA